ncbi:DciA family protein [Propionibacterium freudenreichii]|nr:DciA family protein [Propionibacterium freudenreichii]MDN5984279.1 DciA family protein [Propionibacterium sp.]WBF61892.1 DciA family protein [Propionibacterium freudenreichii]CEG98250.1 Hypothetical protein PFCIRM127_04340 [Propionibacterium freudenreichii]CEH05797.1 Hypothetical protein PFCIRM134_01955 [Propionibacterium freudenreichii]CEI24667.1 Hypothetical protein PFCIRM516_00010 [Propionibacterium freudenreichii]
MTERERHPGEAPMPWGDGLPPWQRDQEAPPEPPDPTPPDPILPDSTEPVSTGPDPAEDDPTSSGSSNGERWDPSGGDPSAGGPDEGALPDDHDPEGFEVATSVAHQLSGMLPPARLGPRKKGRKRRRRARLFDEERSGAGPDVRDPQAVGSAMEKLVNERGWRTQLGLRLIVGRWAELVGPTNAAHSRPESYRDRVLVVRAESSTWASALRLLAPQLVAELNRRLGDGSVIRVDVRGPAAPSWRHGRRTVNGRGPRDTYG